MRGTHSSHHDVDKPLELVVQHPVLKVLDVEDLHLGVVLERVQDGVDVLQQAKRAAEITLRWREWSHMGGGPWVTRGLGYTMLIPKGRPSYFLTCYYSLRSG